LSKRFLGRRGRLTLLLTTALVSLGATAGTAAASTCGDDGTTLAFDSQGYYFDFVNGGTTADRDTPFAAFFDSGSNGPADSPPGPESNSDSYDNFGALFVGGTDLSNMYFSPDNNSCSDPGPGQHDFPVVTMGGLRVQRKVFVNSAAGSLPGARILNLITNPGSAPVTTRVQVGDLLSSDNDGDLGSDETTQVRASSNGDSVASPSDLWAVTNDDPTSTSDNTLAHIVDGVGGALKANVFQLGPGADADKPDNLIWGWTVTIPAGQTVGLMSFEVQQGSPGLPSAPDTASAVAQANAHENAPLSTLYQGMSSSEQQSVVNWNASNAFTAKVKGKKLIVGVSAPGTVAVSDAKAKLSAQSAKKKRNLALKPSRAAGSPPKITVKLKLTKTAQQKLRRTGKVTVKAKITFTPNRGFASTQTKKLKIKSAKKK
jgi:hypothetical protein